ncbi:MAG: hypothetical protein ABIA47_02375 [bacterium]
MKLIRRKPHKYKQAIITSTIIGMVIVVGVWALQVNNMFSAASIEQIQTSYEEVQRQFDEGIAFSEEMEEYAPVLGADFEDVIGGVESAILLQLAQDRALEAVAEGVVERLDENDGNVNDDDIEEEVVDIEPEENSLESNSEDVIE